MNAPLDLTFFLGRFHPVLVHFPIGLICLIAFLELLALWPRFKHANANTGLILAVAAPLSVLTALFGWLLSRGGGYDSELLKWHQWTGIFIAAVIIVAALLYKFKLRRAFLVSLYASFGVMPIVSHLGGSLTHGSDYLVRYAPRPIRALLARGAQGPTKLVPTPDVTEKGTEPQNWQDKAVFASVVQPMIEDKCIGCHGPEKAKGGLRVDSLEAFLKGGENGPVVMAGKPSESQAVKRLLLPLDHDDHMPPNGKPQPSGDDIALLEWWIEGGADASRTFSKSTLTPRITRIVSTRFGSPLKQEIETPQAPAPKPLQEIMPVASRLAEELEIAITALGENEPWLQCNASVAGKRFSDSHLEKLKDLGQNLKWLDLGGTSVSDTGLVHLLAFSNLERLHLQRTDVTDAGLPTLLGLQRLEYLNLHSTVVTDVGVAQLKQAPKLRKLYLWQTKATPAGVTALIEARTDKEQIRLWEEEIERIRARIKAQQMTVELGVTNTTPAVTAKSAMNTECPVSGKPVDLSKTSEYQGKTVAFCCGDCKAKFDNDPKPFLQKLGL